MVMMFREEQDPLPVNPETGDTFRYQMVYDGGRVAYAETFGGLCSALIDGYDRATVAAQVAEEGVAEDALEKRVDVEIIKKRMLYSVGAQVVMQAQINVDNQEAVAALPEKHREMINGTRVTQPDIVEWPHSVPLVLCTYEYEPYGQKPKPTGDSIVWINPFTDRSLIESLSSAGLVSVAYKQDAGVGLV